MPPSVMPHRSRRRKNARPVAACLLALGLGLALLGGCSGVSSNERPLPDSTFTQVLTEIHLQTARHARETPVPPGLRDSIFARYDVRPAAFEATVRYYSRRPQAFDQLYQSVVDTLKALQRPEGSRTIPDSIEDRRRGRSDP